MEMLSWRYPPPYDLYDLRFGDEEQAVENFLDPKSGYYAVWTERDGFIAYRCYGAEAQVPGGDYSEEALDMGGGLRPDLIGRGLGRHVIAAAMAFAIEVFHPLRFRTTVASFNTRAKRVCMRLGYSAIGSFVRSSDSRPFDVFVRDASVPNVGSHPATK